MQTAFKISIQSLYERYVANKGMSSRITREELATIRDTLAQFINYCVDVGNERPVVLSQKKVGGEEYLLHLREWIERIDPLKDLNL